MSEADEKKPCDPTLPPPLNTMTLEEMDAFSDSFDCENCDDGWQPLTPEMKEGKTTRVSLRADQLQGTQDENKHRRGSLPPPRKL